jgi:sugar lactone lactonase YvrE
LVRQLRILCVTAILGLAVLALYIALQTPSSRAQSQNRVAIDVSQSEPAPASRTVAAVAANGAAPLVVASNIGIRTLAVAPPRINQLETLPAAVRTELYFAAVDRPDRLFSFVLPGSGGIAATSAGKFLSSLVAGTGAIGSVGDGGPASKSELDLNLNDYTMRSGVAIGADGTLYIADTGNATIRVVAGPSSSEPGIIRSVAGRWAPRQNVELAEPMGIALDRSGNLYIADHGMNAIDLLNGASSAKAGQLETVAHMVSPASVAVTPDGATVFASSPDAGEILVISTQTHAVRRVGLSASSLLATSTQSSAASRAIPTSLAVDGGGNLFIAYNSPSAAYDQVLRLDALSSQLTVAARGLSNPGDISFDAQGDLFVANQGMRQVLKFKDIGAATTGVTLTPPAPCPGGTTVFCDQLIGGTSAPLAFELSNNTGNAIAGITPSFTGGNASDFTLVSSSCASSLANGASCSFNVAFTPTANATSACGSGFPANARCANLSVSSTGTTTPLTAAVSGIADDFQITCMTTKIFTCPPLSNGAPYQITIAQGMYATFQLEIVPDNTFSGTVTLTCPTDLPVAPAGTIGSPTTCGITAGTGITEPLVNTLALNVTRGTAVPFTVTFQTTTTAGTQTPPPSSSSSTRSSDTRERVAFLPDANCDAHCGPGGPAIPKAGVTSATRLFQRNAQPNLLVLATSLFFAALAGFTVLTLHRGFSRQIAGLTAVIALASFAALLAGCHHGSKTKPVIPYTPTGTYMLTVQGAAQNGSRGFTMTLVVD